MPKYIFYTNCSANVKMNDTQISTKHWEKAMLHANWDMED